MSYLCFACYLHVFGPEWPGWTLERPQGRQEQADLMVAAVEPDSPAARAGLQRGDALRKEDLQRLICHEETGRAYPFDVKLAGGGRRTVSLELNRHPFGYWLTSRAAGAVIAVAISALYLLLAAVIVLARPHDVVARWGSLVLAAMAGFILWYGSGRPAGAAEAIRGLPVAAGAVLLVAPVLGSFGPAVIVTFLMSFPRLTVRRGRLLAMFWGMNLIGSPVVAFGVWEPVYSPESVFRTPSWFGPSAMLTAAAFCLAGAGLVWRNYVRLADPNERRRVRIVVLGFSVTIAGVVLGFVTSVTHGAANQPFPLVQTSSMHPWFRPFLLAAPVCLAYAILRHRVFDIRIIVRQSIQYAAARGVLLSIAPLLGVALAVDMLTHGRSSLLNILSQRGWLYAALAGSAWLLHARRGKWLAALDRRFFRERYDAQRVLREVVEEVRASKDFSHAAQRAILQIAAALHPATAAVLTREPGEHAFRTLACSPAPPPPIPADSKIVGLLRLLGKPLNLPQSDTGWMRQQLPREESEFAREARLEWIFPILLDAASAEAILVLGQKRSEEPYSREDQDLIMAVAASLALLLERAPAIVRTGTGFQECPQCGACYETGAGRCSNDGVPLTPLGFPRLLAQRYRLDRRLGRGGMGTVYEAADTELDRPVAVKLIRSDLTASQEATTRFKREAKAAAALSHPNVVTVFDFGLAEGSRAYLVMELLRGCTLRQELRRGGRIAPMRAGAIATGVCGAIAAAHERRLLHRDLKPENIFLAGSAEAETAKVLDFGVAKLLIPGEETITMSDTAPGMLVGTVQYMAPEQLCGGPPGESWDLWALAVVAYEMLTGAYPFAAAAAADWRQAILAARVIPCRVHVPEAPSSWDAFFTCAFDPDAARRATSALQFAADFHRAVS